MRRVAVLFNTRSGPQPSGLGLPLRDRLSALFTARGVSAELRPFDPATVRADVVALLEERPDALIVVGGDGTVRSVAAHLAESPVPLGVVPMGTMNLLARDLSVPDGLEPAVDALLAAPVRLIDVGRVNDQVFLCSSALAMMPHLGRIRERARGRAGLPLLRLFRHGVRVWRRYPRVRMNIVVDGQEHVVRTRAVVVSNNALSAGPAPLPGRERLDGGRLVVYVTGDLTRWDLLGIASGLLDGSWQTDPRLRRYEGREVRISTSHTGLMSVMSDGEVDQLAMPLRYEIQHRALAVLAPTVSA